MDGGRSLRYEQMRHHRALDLLRIRGAESRSEAAADHHGFEVEEVDRGSDSRGERSNRTFDQACRERVAASERFRPDAARQTVASCLLHQREELGLLALAERLARTCLHRRSAGVRLDAAATAARAARTLALDHHVAEFAGGAAAEPGLAVYDQTPAYAGPPAPTEKRRIGAPGA